MKGLQILVMLLVMLFITGIAGADIPDMVGNWTGPYDAHKADEGFFKGDSGVLFLNITEQKDRIIIGYTSLKKSDGTEEKRDLAGVISADGTEISCAERNNGYSHGTIIGPDEIELTYVSDTDPVRVALDRFYRIV